MTQTYDELSPDDFSATATEAISACGNLDPQAIAKKLGADGLLGILAAEAVGGLGLPLRYAVPVAAQSAAGLLAFPMVETLLAARLFDSTNPDAAARIVSGDDVVTIAWRGAVDMQRDGETVLVSGTVDRAALALAASHVIAFAADGSAILIPAQAAGVAIEPAVSLSLETPIDVVTFANVRASRAGIASSDSAAELRRDALVLRAAACLGSTETSIAMAVEHVSNRRQFGTKLVANQAVRHILARHKLALEGLRSAIDRCFMPGSSPDLKARTAFLHAVDAGILASEGSIQLQGGMGFTWDVVAHRHLRNVRTQGLLGDVDVVRESVARDLIDRDAISG